MSVLIKDYKEVAVSGTAGVKGVAAVPARPAHYTTVQVIEPALLDKPQEVVPQDIPVTSPLTTPTDTTSTRVWPPFQSDKYNWRYATRDEITLVLIGTTWAKRPSYISACEVTFREMELAVRLEWLYERVPYQQGLSGISELALAPYTAGGITAPAFCIGNFPTDLVANPLYEPNYDNTGDFWDPRDTYDCTETNEGLVNMTIKGL